MIQTLAFNIPNPTFSLQHRHRRRLATCVIATLPSCKIINIKGQHKENRYLPTYFI